MILWDFFKEKIIWIFVHDFLSSIFLPHLANQALQLFVFTPKVNSAWYLHQHPWLKVHKAWISLCGILNTIPGLCDIIQLLADLIVMASNAITNSENKQKTTTTKKSTTWMHCWA